MTDRARPRRVLLLSYYFPPAGGAAVQRVLAFARGLPEHGWVPTLVCPDPATAAYPDTDASLLARVPDDLRLLRTRSWDPYAAYALLQGKARQDTMTVGFAGEGSPTRRQRLGRWVRANVFLPDARVGWVPFAIAAAARELRAQRYDAIVTTGPPHSAHLAGAWLAARAGLPWLVDLRDPWTELIYRDELPMTPLAEAIDAALERFVLRRADAAVVVSPAMRRAFERIFPRAYDMVLNGFIPHAAEGEREVAADRFEILHMGNMNAARLPDALFRALAELGAPAAMPGLRLALVGTIDDVLWDAARSEGVDACMEARDFVPHDTSLAWQRQAGLLLLIVDRSRDPRGTMTSKVFEYIASGRPILAIGPPDGDAAAVIREAGAGETFDYDDAEGVRRFVAEHYAAWRAGTPLPGATREAASVYSRAHGTRQLAQILDRISAA